MVRPDNSFVSKNWRDLSQRLVPKDESCETKPISLFLSELRENEASRKQGSGAAARRMFEHKSVGEVDLAV